MMRSNSESAFVKDPTLQKTKYLSAKLTVGATLTLTDDYPDALDLTLVTAAQIALLPLHTDANEGRVFYIYNSAASALTLTVKDSTNTTTIGTIAQSKSGILINIKGTWRIFNGA